MDVSRVRGRSIVVILAVLAFACGNGDPARRGQAGDSELIVSAAASLTDVFAEMESRFEADHDGIDVVVNTGPSSGLREQVLEGAPVDVFASVGMSNMEVIIDAGVATDPRVFARNSLQIAVPAGNPARVTGLQDLGREELLIGLCRRGVPCGDSARQALASAGVVPAADTYEGDVRALLTKIENGELDAGITYITDVVAAAGTVEGVEIEPAHDVVVEYLIAGLNESAQAAAADAFAAYVLSNEGRGILVDHGFVVP